jgi:hypothetical protein
VGLAPDLDPLTWDHSEIDRYGLGHERNVSLFYKLFLIDVRHFKARQICPFVKSGIMHRDFTVFLRPNRLGIDYSHLEQYDTKKKLEDYLLSQQPVWRKNIKDAIAGKDIGYLSFGIEMAGRIGLDKADPKFIEEARNSMQQLQKEKAERERKKRALNQ